MTVVRCFAMPTLASILALTTGTVAMGESALLQPPDRTYDAVMESGFIAVGVYENFPPYSFMSDREPAGVDVAIGKRIAEQLGVAFQAHWIVPDETLQGDLRNNVWKGHYLAKGRIADVMLRVPYDTKYAHMTESTGEMVNEEVVMFGPYQKEMWQIAFDPADIDNVETMAVFQYNPIGVENDSMPDFYLSSAFQGLMRNQTHHYRTIENAFDGMAANEVSAIMGMRGEIDYLLKADPGQRFKLAGNAFPGMVKQQWDVGMAVKSSHRQLKYAIESIVDEMVKSDEMKQIYAVYGLRYDKPAYYDDLAPVAPAAAYPEDPYSSPMWKYNLDRYLGENAQVVLDERVNLEVPPFAEDSSQVPLTLDLSRFDEDVQKVITWVDLNPVPHLFTYEPHTRVTVVSLNFRVQQATTVRAAVQDASGLWHVGSAHLDAAGGGCTAPSVASSNPGWEETFGQIRGRAFSTTDQPRLKVNVRHPMDSGMVGNIPVFAIENLEIRDATGGSDDVLLNMTLYESAAENPTFLFELPDAAPQYEVWMRDNNGNQFQRELGKAS